MIQVLVIAEGKVEGYMDKQAFLEQYCPEYILRSEVKETPIVDPGVTGPPKEQEKPAKEPEIFDQTATLFKQFTFYLPLLLFGESVRSIDISDLPPGLSYDGPSMKIYGTPTKVDSRTITVSALTRESVPRLLQTTFRLSITADGQEPVRPETQPVTESKQTTEWEFDQTNAN